MVGKPIVYGPTDISAILLAAVQVEMTNVLRMADGVATLHLAVFFRAPPTTGDDSAVVLASIECRPILSPDTDAPAGN